MKYSTYLLTILGTILLYGVYEIARFTYLVNESRGLIEQSIPYTVSAQGALHSLLVLGDSTAVGVGTSPDKSVPGRLSETLAVSVENHAQSGARLRDVVSQFDSVETEKYEIILIQAGANDAIYGTSDTEIRENISTVLSKAKKLSSDVVFLTSGDIGEAPLWPALVSNYMTYRTTRVRDIVLSEASKANVVFVDLYASETPFKENPDVYYASDYLHLSGEGYGVWADLIVSAMRTQWPEKYGKE
ncbi:hypothetical protein JXR01_00035 [Candidatus Kaiserbacteria bacterium]|nr:MAG: hypothetical protein JXR01_00035 [Candidatus Kaiserbacteria bacterium]